MGLIPQFDQRTLAAQMQKFAREQEGKFINALAFIGETFVNEARSRRSYQDQTGNLRASIGYAVVKNGSPVKFDDLNNFGRQKITESPGDGIYLIVFAGMEYALYVEAKGYDVLTGSKPTRREVVSLFKDLLDE